MAEEQDSSEKTEKATPHKLQEAKKKGMAGKSQDINSLLIMAVGLAMLYAIGDQLVMRTFHLGRDIMAQAGVLHFSIEHLVVWSTTIFHEGLGILLTYTVPLMLIAVLVSMLQTGFIFSFFPLQPDVQKINPAKGFKRIFSAKTLVELGKSILKIGVFGLIIYFTIVEYMPELMGLTNRPPEVFVSFFIKVLGVLVFRILIALVLIALIDLLFVKWDHQRQMRMSKRELKDEHKRFEGDPLVKQKRKDISKELLEKSKSLTGAKDADAVITNPTHYAVAIKYDPNTMVAPKTVGKGMGGLAYKIRQVASTYQVPVIESPSLARRLYKHTKVGGYIREDEYMEVAGILRKVYAIHGKQLV